MTLLVIKDFMQALDYYNYRESKLESLTPTRCSSIKSIWKQLKVPRFYRLFILLITPPSRTEVIYLLDNYTAEFFFYRFRIVFIIKLVVQTQFMSLKNSYLGKI